MNKLRYCPHCVMQLEEGSALCPQCGKNVAAKNEAHQLPVGTLLENRYWIGSVIGEGGFGITYIGRDTKLDMRVAVKEYYPFGIANRYHTASQALSVSKSDVDGTFEHGRKGFLDEARVLAQFAGEPHIVNVRDYFEANNTAYIVMEYLDGESLQQYFKNRGAVSFSQALEMLEPVMDVLNRVHEKGLIHRDISPTNLMVLPSGSVKLLDFGTARSIAGQSSRSLSVVLKPGYAPAEQYNSHGNQGPWTDVYSLCATIYKMITGVTPENAMNRLFSDTLAAPSALGALISPAQEKVLLRGMALNAADRPQSMEQLKRELRESLAQAAVEELEEEDDERTVYGPKINVGQSSAPTASQVSAHPAPQPDVPEAHHPVRETPQEGKEETAVPEKPRSVDKVQASKKKKKKKGGVMKGVAAIAVVCCLIAVVLLGGTSLNKNPYIDSDSPSSASVKDTVVTSKTVQTIKRDTEVKSLSLYRCEISDEMIAQLAQIDHVTSLYFNNCTGFSSLEPLAQMTSLKKMELWGDSTSENPLQLDAQTMFPQKFENLEELSVLYYGLSDHGSVLNQFPSLHYLHLSDVSDEIDLHNLTVMNELKSLWISDSEIVGGDFSPLSENKELKELRLSELGMTECTWMEPLEHLYSVEVKNNQLTNLDGLRNHVELSCLVADGNQITDISGLTGCSAVRILELSGNQITELSVLEKMEELSKLTINDNQIQNIDALSGCPKLSQCELCNNQIAKISGLSGCTEMTWLYLNNNQMTDISALENCTKMTYLHLDGNQLTNLNACERMIDLKELTANDNQIADLSGLVNTTQLETIRLRGNQIRDITPLGKNTEKMNVVLLADNQITDISALSGASKLQMLTIDGNQITSLSPLSDSTGLEYLSAGNNQINDISAVGGCTRLSYLDLGDNQISDISVLTTCTAPKQALLLQNNQISDISMLAVGPEYYKLYIYGNPIQDCSVLSEICKNGNSTYDELGLSWNEKMDFEPIAGIDESIFLVDIPLDRQAGLKEQHESVIEEEYGRWSKAYDFLTQEEADERSKEIRKQARDSEAQVVGGINVQNMLEES